ncbi:MAG: hypothetical protein K8L99_29415 [Anaerolineae bacterium]|nr:hypothetical protein [Anaerolineae bacterium]
MKRKTTPAIKRATQNLKTSLEGLRHCDLADMQERLEHSPLDTGQRHALSQVLGSMRQLVEAEALRDRGGHQTDMFADMDDSEFAAWMRPINQRALF